MTWCHWYISYSCNNWVVTWWPSSCQEWLEP
jgi:hypothetical protein